MRLHVRLPMLAALCMLSPHVPAEIKSADLSGVWTGLLCPSGVLRDPARCSNFVIELLQKDDKLCGTHVFATAGAARLDEGEGVSIAGDVAGGMATVTVQSGRASPPVRVRVELKISRGWMQWRRLENPAGDYLLPLSAQLTKSSHKTLRTPMLEQHLRAACTALFSRAPDSAAAQPAGTSSGSSMAQEEKH